MVLVKKILMLKLLLLVIIQFKVQRWSLRSCSPMRSPVICDMCGQAPCNWESFGEDIWEECHALTEAGMDNKAVRYHAYKIYTRMRHGVLHRFDQQPLPICVRGEIMDEWPDPKYSYVGFQAVVRDAATET
jgi:hypothetical protein